MRAANLTRTFPFQDEPGRVYLLYDHRVTSMGVPQWVSSNFVDRHEEVVNSGGAANQRHQNVDVRNGRDSADSSMGYFEVLSGNFDAGQICLGGNGGDHDALEQDAFDGHCSNYVVFVGPQELEPFFPGSAGASAPSRAYP